MSWLCPQAPTAMKQSALSGLCVSNVLTDRSHDNECYACRTLQLNLDSSINMQPQAMLILPESTGPRRTPLLICCCLMIWVPAQLQLPIPDRSKRLHQYPATVPQTPLHMALTHSQPANGCREIQLLQLLPQARRACHQSMVTASCHIVWVCAGSQAVALTCPIPTAGPHPAVNIRVQICIPHSL